MFIYRFPSRLRKQGAISVVWILMHGTNISSAFIHAYISFLSYDTIETHRYGSSKGGNSYSSPPPHAIKYRPSAYMGHTPARRRNCGLSALVG